MRVCLRVVGSRGAGARVRRFDRRAGRDSWRDGDGHEGRDGEGGVEGVDGGGDEGGDDGGGGGGVEDGGGVIW